MGDAPFLRAGATTKITAHSQLVWYLIVSLQVYYFCYCYNRHSVFQDSAWLYNMQRK